MLLSASFIAKFGRFLSQHCKTLFPTGFILKQTERPKVLKNDTRDFQNSPPFERSACFYKTINGNFECFLYFNFETDSLENATFLKKTGVPFFSWRQLDWNPPFPYKTAISVANFKTNRKVSRKWTYHKELRFASNYFIFKKILLFVSAEVLFDGAFFLWASLTMFTVIYAVGYGNKGLCWRFWPLQKTLL